MGTGKSPCRKGPSPRRLKPIERKRPMMFKRRLSPPRISTHSIPRTSEISYQIESDEHKANDPEEKEFVDAITRRPSFDIASYPSLPLVDIDSVVNGEIKPVILEEAAYVPTRPVSLLSFLADTSLPELPQKRTTRQKLTRKVYQAGALLKNCQAHPRDLYLKRGANYRINLIKESLQDRVRRLINPKQPRPSNQPPERPLEPVPSPLLRSPRYLKSAPPRFVPPIPESGKLPPDPVYDHFLNPLGGDFEAFSQSGEERAARIKETEKENRWRVCSERHLSQQGREDLADPLIGKVPPLSKRQFIEPLKQKALLVEERKDDSDPQLLSSLPEAEIKDLVSKETEATQLWDLGFLPKIPPPHFSDFVPEDPLIVYIATQNNPLPISLRQVRTANSQIQSTGAVNDTLVSLRQGLRPVTEKNPAFPSRNPVLEGRRPPFRVPESPSVSTFPPSKTTPHTDRAISAWARSTTTAAKSEYPYAVFEAEQARIQQRRPTRSRPEGQTPFANRSTSRQVDSDDSLSDYTEDRPTSEERLIEEGKFVAAQNSIRFAEEYGVGNPYTESPQKESTTAELSSPLAVALQSIPDTPLTQTTFLSDPSAPAPSNLWEDSPEEEEKKSVRGAAERKLSGVGPYVPEDPDVDKFSLVSAGYDANQVNRVSRQISCEEQPLSEGRQRQGPQTLSYCAIDQTDPFRVAGDSISPADQSPKANLDYRQETKSYTVPEQFSPGEPYYAQRNPSLSTQARHPHPKCIGRGRAPRYPAATPVQVIPHPQRVTPKNRYYSRSNPTHRLYQERHPSQKVQYGQRIEGDIAENWSKYHTGFTPESSPTPRVYKKQFADRLGENSTSGEGDTLTSFPTYLGALTPESCSLPQFDHSRLQGLDLNDFVELQSVAAKDKFGVRRTPHQPSLDHQLHKPSRLLPEVDFESSYDAANRAIKEQHNQHNQIRKEFRVRGKPEHIQNRVPEPVESNPVSNLARNDQKSPPKWASDPRDSSSRPTFGSNYPFYSAENGKRFVALSHLIIESNTAAQAKLHEEFDSSNGFKEVQRPSAISREEIGPSYPLHPQDDNIQVPSIEPRTRKATLSKTVKRKWVQFIKKASKKSPLEDRLDELEAGLEPERPSSESSSPRKGLFGEGAYHAEYDPKPPVIPEKSPARQALLQNDRVTRQNQSLSFMGSGFDHSLSTTYPAVVGESNIASAASEGKGQTDLPAIVHSSQLPFTITPAGDQSTTVPSDTVDSARDTLGITISSVSTPPRPSTGVFEDRPSKTFLDSCLPARAVHRVHFAEMENKLQVRPAEFSSVKTKAVEDARQMQATVIEDAKRTGKDPPKYVLVELTGKGSFGRVYKGKDMSTAAIVAVKIIDIDESDTVNPRNADSYSEFLKEVNALKILSENKARNINHVIEALPVGKAMWMITEYCGGGSIATLMKPTAPGGLQEKWIIPILREVAEAIKWVHQAGIIHRDIKCANVLVTEEGGVQLCDFGVAGVIETKVDKRSTVIGTPHWMAPELFGPTPSYGKEVDIWAFGSMVFEIATGLPPNVANGIPYERLGTHLKHNVPRLEGGNYSNDLRNLVAYCLEELPSVRPTIEQVQKHQYIHNTSSKFPASTLSHLVRAFKMWEDHGGSRKSLFMIGGAQGPSESSSSLYDDEWNFSTTAAFDQEVSRDANPQDVYEAYGTSVLGFSEETSRPYQQQKALRRRPPPEALARLPAPLEKIFDPNTLSSYDENSRNHYGRVMAPPTSDLPLRDDTVHTSIRDTMIDLGGHDSETGLSSFPDMDTIKADRRGVRDESEDEYGTLHDFSRPALSDPADINPNRRTQDWKFPTMAPPVSADPETSRFPISYEPPRPAVTPASGGRPALVHHPTEPVGVFGGMLGPTNTAMERMSMRESLIDLDMSLPDLVPEITRPSTANSDVESTASSASEYTSSGNPFELERHASIYQPAHIDHGESSIHLTEDVAARLNPANPLQEMTDMSDFSASDVELSTRNGHSELTRYDGGSDSDYLSMASPPARTQAASEPVGATLSDPRYMMWSIDHLPELPPPPSAAALAGTASRNEMKEEVVRQLAGMTDQLAAFKNVYESEQFVNRAGQTSRRGGRGGGANGDA